MKRNKGCFPKMAAILNENKVGKAELKRFVITDNDFCAKLQGIPCGEYMSLLYNNCLLMSDTPMERRTNMRLLTEANGDVLIAGLGLGMILFPLEEDDAVKSITVIEKSTEIIELVWSQIKHHFKKVRVINADIFEWSPRKKDREGKPYFNKGFKFDTIYFDIWPYVNSDIYEEMKQLKVKYRPYLKTRQENEHSNMNCWAESYARYNRPLY